MRNRTELMIVISFFLTAAVIFSAGSGRRRSAGRTVCLDNLRRLTAFSHQYQADNRDFFPPLIIRERTWRFWMHAINEYVTDAMCYYCPANPRSGKIISEIGPAERDLLPSVFDISSVSYGMNCMLSSDGRQGRKSKPWRASACATPDYTVYFGDCRMLGGYSLRPTRHCWHQDYAPVHAGVSNFSFIDGHASPLPKEELGLLDQFKDWKRDRKRWENWK